MDGQPYRRPSTLIPPPMQIELPKLSPEAQAALERYKAAREEFERARDETDRLDADLQKHRKAAEAAEAEAQQARADAAQLMRNTGASMKDIHALKAKERAAYTLAEDYRAIVAEFQTALNEVLTKAGVAKEEEAGAYNGVLRARADSLMAEAVHLVAPLFPAIRMQEMANAHSAATPGGADWQYFNETSRKAALSTLFGVIEQGLSAWTPDHTSDPALEAAKRPAGRERFKVVSVAALHRDNVLRQQAAARKNAALSPSA